MTVIIKERTNGRRRVSRLRISPHGGDHMIRDDKAIFTIGTAAKMLELHPRTLRLYENDGLIKPSRKGQWRYYTMDDLKWIECLRNMIHKNGISIAAIKKLLKYTPCWNVADCAFEKRKQCTAFMSNGLVPKKIEIPAANKKSGGSMIA
jgi:MerR family transcriptional regulator, heat shock protein HspR